MFRFIHAADPHLDSPLQGLEAHAGAPVERLRGATRRAFENLVQLALDERVDALLIAGDLYDGDWKDYSTGLFFRGQMVRLRDRGIPVYVIAGNHDAASVISRKLSVPDNVHFFSTRAAETKEVPGHPVVIHGRGFPHRAVPENLVLDYPAAVAGKLNIGLLHTSLNGRGGHDTYAPCSEGDLREKGYAYWALGHVHQPEVISRDPWIVFAGNCQGRHIREAGRRGCQLVTVNDALEVSAVDWRSLDVLRWNELVVDLSGCDEEHEALRRVRAAFERSVDEAEGRMVAARLVLTGATSQHGKWHRDLSRLTAEVLAVAQDQGADVFWLEQVRVATRPVYDLGLLAERDDLTKLVLESLEDPRSMVLPAEITEMLEVMPGELRGPVEADWDPAHRSATLSDVRAIILDALGTQGESR